MSPILYVGAASTNMTDFITALETNLTSANLWNELSGVAAF